MVEGRLVQNEIAPTLYCWYDDGGGDCCENESGGEFTALPPDDNGGPTRLPEPWLPTNRAKKPKSLRPIGGIIGVHVDDDIMARKKQPLPRCGEFKSSSKIRECLCVAMCGQAVGVQVVIMWQCHMRNQLPH